LRFLIEYVRCPKVYCYDPQMWVSRRTLALIFFSLGFAFSGNCFGSQAYELVLKCREVYDHLPTPTGKDRVHPSQFTDEEGWVIDELWASSRIRELLFLFLRKPEKRHEASLEAKKTLEEMDYLANILQKIILKSQLNAPLRVYRGERFPRGTEIPKVGDTIDYFHFPNAATGFRTAHRYSTLYTDSAGFGRMIMKELGHYQSVVYELELEAGTPALQVGKFDGHVEIRDRLGTSVIKNEIVLPRDTHFEVLSGDRRHFFDEDGAIDGRRGARFDYFHIEVRVVPNWLEKAWNIPGSTQVPSNLKTLTFGEVQSLLAQSKIYSTLFTSSPTVTHQSSI
jgi:hypothetical protein